MGARGITRRGFCPWLCRGRSVQPRKLSLSPWPSSRGRQRPRSLQPGCRLEASSPPCSRCASRHFPLGGARGAQRRRRGTARGPAAAAGQAPRLGVRRSGGRGRSGSCHELSREPAATCRGGDAAAGGAPGVAGGDDG